MRVAVTGPRGKWSPPGAWVRGALALSPYTPTEVLHGGADGVDAIATRWATENHGLSAIRIPARWQTEGQSAGPRRNRRMLDRADALIAIARTDNPTPGTYDCISEAWRRGMPMYIVYYHGKA